MAENPYYRYYVYSRTQEQEQSNDLSMAKLK